MSTKKYSLLLTTCFAAWASGGSLLQAQTVSWGGSLSDTPLSYVSDGSMDNAVLTWTLGWFDNGFIPTQDNYSEWVINYVPTQETSSHRFEGGVWTTQHNTANVGAAATGRQMYTFAYNDLDLIGQPGGEALLFTQTGLTFPSVPNQVTFDMEDGPDPADDAFAVIWGRVDRNMYATGGVSAGGGVFTALTPDSDGTSLSGAGTFESQSATFVPEAGSALLAFLGGTLALRRRRPARN